MQDEFSKGEGIELYAVYIGAFATARAPIQWMILVNEYQPG
ncbi:hypothetical protein [Longibacter sp.]